MCPRVGYLPARGAVEGGIQLHQEISQALKESGHGEDSVASL